MAEAIRKTALGLAHVGEFLGIDNLDPESGKILVTGGMGSIGHRVAARLLQAGYPLVRIGASDDDVQEMVKLGAEVSDFSWDKEETYEPALLGVKSVLITLPYEQNWHLHFPAFLRACHAANVKHMVKLSFYHARVPHDNFRHVPFVKQHAECDDLLLGMVKRYNEVTFPKMSYTILYTTLCMSLPLYFLQDGEVTDASGTLFGVSNSHGTNYVSPNDVAEVAVRVLLEPRAHYDKEYTLTGPGPISGVLVADHLTKYLQKPVSFVEQSLEEYEATLVRQGKPHWMIADMVALEKVKLDGVYEHLEFISEDIDTICNHRPETFDEYLVRTDAMTRVEVGAPSELKPLKAEMTV